MDRKTASRIWREVSRGAPDGVPTGRTLHEFAQRCEALAISGCDKRHAAAKAIGGQLSNVAFNLAQRVGQPIDTHDAGILDKLRKEWDACIRTA